MIKKELETSDWPPVGQVTYMSANLDEDDNNTQVYIDSIPLDGSINISWWKMLKMHSIFYLANLFVQ